MTDSMFCRVGVRARAESTIVFLAGAIALCATASVYAQTANVTVETISPFQETLRRGQTLTLNYKFSVTGPTSTAYKVFAHIINAADTIVLQDDHFPPTATTLWSNVNVSPIPDVSYSRSLVIPTTFAYGDYRVAIGLYDPSTNVRLLLNPGSRVVELSAGTKSYVTSNLTVTSRAIRTANFTCDGVTNRAAELNADLAILQSGTSKSLGEIYKLPKGVCLYSGLLSVGNKNYVDITGAGIPDTVLHATDRTKSSLVIFSGTGVTVRDPRVRRQPS